MAYNIVATDEVNKLLDNCVKYLLNKFKSEQAAVHLLDEVSEIYERLEDNPNIYRLSSNPFMRNLGYHEAKISEMDYMIIYKIDGSNVYILGIYHTLENYVNKLR